VLSQCVGSGKHPLFRRGNELDTSSEMGGGRGQFAFASQIWRSHFLGKMGGLAEFFGPVLKELCSYRNVACAISGEELFR